MFDLKKILPIAIFVLILVQIGLSGYLIYESNTSGYICVVGQSCDYVQNTQYGMLFGIKLAYLSIVAFFFLGIIYFVSRILFLLSSILGACFAIYFISIQLFVLHSICSTCFIIDWVTIGIFILAIINHRYNKKEKKDKPKKKKQEKKK